MTAAPAVLHVGDAYYVLQPDGHALPATDEQANRIRQDFVKHSLRQRHDQEIRTYTVDEVVIQLYGTAEIKAEMEAAHAARIDAWVAACREADGGAIGDRLTQIEFTGPRHDSPGIPYPE